MTKQQYTAENGLNVLNYLGITNITDKERTVWPYYYRFKYTRKARRGNSSKQRSKRKAFHADARDHDKFQEWRWDRKII